MEKGYGNILEYAMNWKQFRKQMRAIQKSALSKFMSKEKQGEKYSTDLRTRTQEQRKDEGWKGMECIKTGAVLEQK